jgi:hypothetical protein
MRANLSCTRHNLYSRWSVREEGGGGGTRRSCKDWSEGCWERDDQIRINYAGASHKQGFGSGSALNLIDSWIPPGSLIFTQIYEFSPVFSEMKAWSLPLYDKKMIKCWYIHLLISPKLCYRGLDPGLESAWICIRLALWIRNRIRGVLSVWIRILMKRMRILNTDHKCTDTVCTLDTVYIAWPHCQI